MRAFIGTLVGAALLLTYAVAAQQQATIVIGVCDADPSNPTSCGTNCTKYKVPEGKCWNDPLDTESGWRFQCRKYPKCFSVTPYLGAGCKPPPAAPQSAVPCNVCQSGSYSQCIGNVVAAYQCENQQCMDLSNCSLLVKAPLGGCVDFTPPGANQTESVYAPLGYKTCAGVHVTQFFNWNQSVPRCSGTSSYSYTTPSGSCNNAEDSKTLSFTCVWNKAELGDVLEASDDIMKLAKKAAARPTRNAFLK